MKNCEQTVQRPVMSTAVVGGRMQVNQCLWVWFHIKMRSSSKTEITHQNMLVLSCRTSTSADRTDLCMCAVFFFFFFFFLMPVWALRKKRVLGNITQGKQLRRRGNVLFPSVSSL